MDKGGINNAPPNLAVVTSKKERKVWELLLAFGDFFFEWGETALKSQSSVVDILTLSTCEISNERF